MKHTLILILFFMFIPLFVCSQNGHFEGVIYYNCKFETSDPDLDLKPYKDFYGTSAIIFIRQGQYRQVYENVTTGIEFVEYDYKTNFYFYKMAGIDTLFYVDCSEPEHHYKATKIDSMVSVLNYDCKQLNLFDGEKEMKFYYTEKLPLEPQYYKKHKMGGYNLISEKARSVYLLSVIYFKRFNFTMVAEKVTKKTLDDKVFALPDLPVQQKYWPKNNRHK
jgi:hypothetical protein